MMFKHISKNLDKATDEGKPNILIILPVYHFMNGEESFADMTKDFNDPHVDLLSLYKAFYKVFCYNKMLLVKFEKDIYYTTILEKQREWLAANSLELSEQFTLLMRMFHELDEINAKEFDSNLESLIAYALINKEREFLDIKNDENTRAKCMLKISNVLKDERDTIEKYFENCWKNFGFSKDELKTWLTNGFKSEDIMSTARLDDIISDLESLRNNNQELNKIINLRHKLTANIEYNLYSDGGNKPEGRRALTIRNALDESLFNLVASDMIDGDSSALEYIKKAITLETLSERMRILEGVTKDAQLTSMKTELINLLTDTDRFSRFIPTHQKLIKEGATGLAFLANWRINKVIDALQQEAKKIGS